nr:hypothetical protein CparaKRNrm1_p130 [Cryptomonas paramecium]
MVCYVKKTHKQQLEKKLFDWTCFLNNTYSCSFGKKNKMILYKKKNIKNTGRINTVYQKKYEKNNRNFKNTNITHKINNIDEMSFFVLNNSFKKNFISLRHMIKNIKNIFTFVSLNTEKSKIIHHTRIYFSENKNTFFSCANKIFFTLHGIHFECKLFEKINEICLFKKRLFPLKTTYQILFEYYTHLSNFALRKNSILCNFKFITDYIVRIDSIPDTRHILVKKDYEFRKKFVLFEKKPSKHKKIYYGYCDFFLKKNHNIHNKSTWIYSKNVKLPFFSLTENLVLYVNTFQSNCLSILKYLNSKFLFFNKKKTITHVFFKKKAIYSLICIPIKFSWISDIVNNCSMLPACLNWTKSKKKININPFYLKFFGKKNKKVDNLYFKYKYTKKNFVEKELFYDTISWFIETGISLFTRRDLVRKKKNNYVTIFIFSN